MSTGSLVGVAWIAGKPEPLAHLKRSGVPVFSDPVRCAKAIAARLRWEATRHEVAPTRQRESGAATARRARRRTSTSLRRAGGAAATRTASRSRPPPSSPTPTRRGASPRVFGYPVAAKLVARNLAHKSEIGGVRLGIDSDDALGRAVAALDAIPIADKEGILIQKMVGGGLEVFVGMKRDDVFGPVIVVGLGGIYVEIIRETVMRLAPFDRGGRRAAHSPVEVLCAAGRRARAARSATSRRSRRSYRAFRRSRLPSPSVRSLDLNPVIVRESGAQVVDFKFECRADGERAVAKPIRRVLIANRGEIAVRVNRTCRDMGIETVQVYSEADRDSLAVKLADRAVCIGGPRSSESYLNQTLLVHAAMAFKADAVHPGYGFLSENPDFAALCVAQGLTWIGPDADVIRLMGNKAAARAAAADAGLRTTPGSAGHRSRLERSGRRRRIDRLSAAPEGLGGRRWSRHAPRRPKARA